MEKGMEGQMTALDRELLDLEGTLCKGDSCVYTLQVPDGDHSPPSFATPIMQMGDRSEQSQE